MIFFQQYGAQRSGTNYSKQLFNKNYINMRVIEFLSSKHHPPISSEQYTTFIPPLDYLHQKFDKECCELFLQAVKQHQIKNLIIIRNPYAWIESLWRIGLELESDPDSFIYFERPPAGKGDLTWLFKRPPIEKQAIAVEKSIVSYNTRYRKWFSSATEILRQEDLLFDYQFVLRYFEKKYNLVRTHSDFLDLKKPCGPHIESDFGIKQNIQIDTPNKNIFYKDYYLNHRYMKNLPISTINLITQTVDWELFKEIGYFPFT